MSKIQIKSFDKWDFENEIDLMICDIPFSIKFTGKASNYNRKKDLVVDGYVEWGKNEFHDNIIKLFISAEKYLSSKGSLLLFSGWQISPIISHYIYAITKLHLQGKLYWNYNFAPYCKKRPAHNIYEIFWLTKSKKNWIYNNKCNQSHCTVGEANLSAITVKKEYLRGIPKYPTKLPSELIRVLIEHFTNKDSIILDLMCGSGIVGVVNELYYNRKCYLGDLNPNSQIVHDELLKYFGDKK